MDIKICGLSTNDAVDAVIAGGASHAGFIFFPKSPRNIEPARASDLAEKAKAHGVAAVAVTVNADDLFLAEIIDKMHPDMLQLHGSETPGRVAEIRARYGLPVIKALAIRDATDLAQIHPYRGIADRFLFDARPPAGAELPGGNGVAFDWQALGGLDPDINYMLSGGLNADNIGPAIKLLHPPGIDVSSGVERSAGIKDPALIEQFFRSVRKAEKHQAA